MAECRYFPECQRCNEVGDSWIPCEGGSDGTRCLGYEPMPDANALLELADEMDAYSGHFSTGMQGCTVQAWAYAIREALGVES